MKKLSFKKIVANGLLVTALASTTQVSAAEITVKKGDTLWSYSQKYNVTVSELMKFNNLSSSLIYPGDILHTTYAEKNISVKNENTNETSIYTVVKGDSLWKISRKFGITVQNLKDWNNLTSDLIYPNQKLNVKTSNINKTNTPSEKTKENTSSFEVETLISTAKKYMGVPYQWGGSTPSGFDCSGFLNYVFGEIGVSIPRTVATIWDSGKTVSTPKVGDIVFYETYKEGPSHAGIYLGDNKFIHASVSKGVTISDMTTSYWTSRYLGAKTFK